MQEGDKFTWKKKTVFLSSSIVYIQAQFTVKNTNATIGEKIDFEIEMLHKKVMKHESVFLLYCKIKKKSWLVLFLHSIIH